MLDFDAPYLSPNQNKKRKTPGRFRMADQGLATDLTLRFVINNQDGITEKFMFTIKREVVS